MAHVYSPSIEGSAGLGQFTIEESASQHAKSPDGHACPFSVWSEAMICAVECVVLGMRCIKRSDVCFGPMDRLRMERESWTYLLQSAEGYGSQVQELQQNISKL